MRPTSPLLGQHRLVSDYMEAPVARYELRGRTLTFGDLHGNVLVLIHALSELNLITIGAKTYSTLSSLLYWFEVEAQDDFDSSKVRHLKAITEIIDEITIKPVAQTIRLRFLGSLLASTRHCDYFMLKLLYHLHEGLGGLEIIPAKSDCLFLINYLEETLENPFILTPQGEREHFSDLLKKPDRLKLQVAPYRSLYHCYQLIANDLVSSQEVAALFQAVVVPNLSIISYTAHQHASETSLSIHSHAPMDLGAIYRLYRHLAPCSGEILNYGHSIQLSLDIIIRHFNVLLNNKAKAVAAIENSLTKPSAIYYECVVGNARALADQKKIIKSPFKDKSTTVVFKHSQFIEAEYQPKLNFFNLSLANQRGQFQDKESAPATVCSSPRPSLKQPRKIQPGMR